MKKRFQIKRLVFITIVLAAMVFGLQQVAPCLSFAASEPPAGSLKSKVSLPANFTADRFQFRKSSDRNHGRIQKTAVREADKGLTGNGSESINPINKKIADILDAACRDSVRITSRQRKLLRSSADSDPSEPLRVLFDRTHSVPFYMKLGEPKTGSPKTARSAAQLRKAAGNFLRTNKTLFKINDSDSEFSLAKEQTDSTGVTHLRYQQTCRGVPIWGREVSVHADTAGDVFLYSGNPLPSPKTPVENPALTAPEAAQAALRHLNIDESGDTGTPELFYFKSSDGKLSLAYKVDVSSKIDQGWICFIDAMNGDLIHRISKIQNELRAGSGLDLSGVNRSFNVWSEGDYDYMIDPSIPYNDPPHSPLPDIKNYGDTYVLDARHGEDSVYFVSKNRYSGDWDPAAVSVAYNIKRVNDYYKNTFNRNGIDNQYMNYLVVIHLSRNYAGAFWNGKFVVLGDGDNRIFTSLADSLDVLAHEIQHGVTQNTAGLIYENQSGALNEAYSDIMACMVDRDDWTVGEDVTLISPGYLRNLIDPSLAPDPLPTTMSEYKNLPNTEKGDFGGVHINMSIPSRAAYLMADGLSAEGLGRSIGREKTEQIFYHALTHYLKASSQFIDGRMLTIESARQLYGSDSTETAAVQAAWDAVEVYGENIGTPDDQKPSDADPISGSDIMAYLYPQDGSHNPSGEDEAYDLYIQKISEPFTGYSEENDIGPLNLAPVHYTRPAAVTEGYETIVFYIGADNNLYAVNLDGSEHTQITRSGNMHSFTISPDGLYYAYTSVWTNDKNIYVGNLNTSQETAYPVKPMTDLPPGMEDYINTVLYADSLAFDYTGRTLVFDALNCISTDNDPCGPSEGGHRYWSIGFLDVGTGGFEFPFPNQNPDVDIAYPSFAYNNNYVIALDVIDYMDFVDKGAVYSSVWTLNWHNQTDGYVCNPNLGPDDHPVYGVPGFWGNDDYITTQSIWEENGVLNRIPVLSDWSGDEGRAEQINRYAAAMPFMHRAGNRNLSAELDVNPSAINFTDVSVGTSMRRSVTLSNSGDRDINITNISLTGSSEFRHNGVNAILPRKKSMSVSVTYTPTSSGSSSSAELWIESDADIPQKTISLTGSTASDSQPEEDDEGGGGCFIDSAASGLYRFSDIVFQKAINSAFFTNAHQTR